MRIRGAFHVLAGALALAGCASRSLSPDDLQRTCRFGIGQQASSPGYNANPFSNVGGGVIGAGTGVLMLNPPLFVLGLIGGSACAAGSLAHPTAEADFTRLLHDADFATFKRALDQRLNAPRDACRSPGGAASPSPPDATAIIDSVTATMGCLYGHHQYWLEVKWRVKDALTGRELASSANRCMMASWRTVDDWFADPVSAKSEIERLMAGTGTAVAESVLGVASSGSYSICELRSHENGEAEVKRL